MIYFHDRNTHYEINGSYLVGGKESVVPDTWMKGDTVFLLVKLTPDETKKINDYGRNLRAWNDRWNGKEIPKVFEIPPMEPTIHIPLIVTEKRHSAFLDESQPRLAFRLLETSVVLEAISDPWQEVFMWIVFGEVPEWAKEEKE